MSVSPNDVLKVLATADKPLRSDNVFPEIPYEAIKAVLDRLKSREMLQYEVLDREEVQLTPEGEGIVQNGSHEARVFEAVKAAMEGLSLKDLQAKVGAEAAKVGRGNAFRQKWIGQKKDSKDVLVATTNSITDTTREQLQRIQQSKTCSDPKLLSDLRKRKLVTTRKVITFRFEKGPKYTSEFVELETDITSEMLASGSWRSAPLKPYNFNSKGAPISAGALHPLNKVRTEFRQIFFEMGFTEMPTNRFVESGFWNFDALFVPQQHPARDTQDTFYISEPPRADPPRDDPPSSNSSDPLPSSPSHKRKTSKSDPSRDYQTYWNNIRTVHESGKYGSIGYRYPWSPDESTRLVLRTHTTAVSATMMHALAADPKPARYFSIDRVFRNESVDQTHLAEFHQVEGVIADFNLTLGGLIGFMKVFFSKMGINSLKFKPAYNPYTEPSMEIFGWHEGLGKLIEIGNSGMFRPEVLEPMGLPKDMRVYGWGLSLERPTMIKYGVSNIRELLGHKVDLNFIETNPAVRLEKD
ncbi:MAG: hypothetical protein Q9227_000140 [Pyrenula ochraceoflavens]